MTDRITKERKASDFLGAMVELYRDKIFAPFAAIRATSPIADGLCKDFDSSVELLRTRLLDLPAPTLMDLRGIAPDATGDLSSEEFVRRVRDGWTPPTDEARWEMVEWLDDYFNCPPENKCETCAGPMLKSIKTALLQSPPKVSVTRERLEAACEKFSGHWAGTADDIRRLGMSILSDLGIAVVDSDRPGEGEEK